MKLYLRLAFAAALLFVFAAPASAQYMFLDANGDAQHTSSDIMNPNGTPTTVDVYVVTNQNRDGSTPVCDLDGISPLSLNAYVFNLEAVGGNATYSGFTNQMGSAFSTSFGELNTGNNLYKNGLGSQTTLDPGKFRLATVTITGTSGAPTINIVDKVLDSTDITNFGTGVGGCFGHDFDSTYKLTGPAGGSDWTDVDGLGPAPGGNAPPTLTVATTLSATEGQLVTIEATATDPNPGDVLTITHTTSAAFLTTFTSTPGTSPVTATLSGTPPVGSAGAYGISWTVTDGTNPPVTGETQVVVSPGGGGNACPVLAPIGDKTVTGLSELTFTATATDADAGQTLTFSLGDGAPTGAAIDPATGVFTWTPTDAQSPGSYAILVQVTDNASTPCADTETIQVTVNDTGGQNNCPVLASIGNQTVTEGNLLSFTATATDADVGQTLAFSLDPGFPTGAAINSSTGMFTWTPTDAQGPGTYAVTVRVTDNADPSCSDFETIQVTVNDAGGQNNCPELASIGNKTVTEGNLLTFTATATDADPGQTLTFSLGANTPTGASINPSTGVFTWTPTTDQGPGTYPIAVRVTDNASPACTDSEVVTVTVNDSGQNQCPVLASIGDKTVTEGNLLTFTATATDPDVGQILAFSLDPGFPTGAAINSSTGLFTWTPTTAQGPGTYSVTVRVTDNADPSCSDFETIQVTVNDSANQCPVLNAIGDKTVTEGNLLTFTAIASDPDPGQTLTFSLDAGFPTGASIHPSTGVFTWTPTTAQGPGTYTTTVRVADSGDPSCSDFETIQVTVNDSANQCPVLNAIGNKTVTEGNLLTFTATATDPDAGQTLTFSLDAGFPAGASIHSSTGVFTWTPTTPGAYTLTVRVTDNADPSCSDFETIQVSVLSSGGGAVSVNAFFIGGNKKTRLWTGKPETCLQLEIEGADNTSIDLSTLVLEYNGQQIQPVSADLSRDTDRDGNGEIQVCFSKEDLRTLFAGLPTGESTVSLTISGSLTTGDTFSTAVSHVVVARGDKHAGRGGNGGNGGNDATARPNPLNPSTVLEFTVAHTGQVKVQVFSATGRLVKTLHDGTMQEGLNTLRWDGSSSTGSRVASGVYYFRIVTAESREIVRVTVLK